MKNQERRDEVVKLRMEGNTHGQIMKITGLSRSTVQYYCMSKEQKENAYKTRKRTHPFKEKFRVFLERKHNKNSRKYLESPQIRKLLTNRTHDFRNGEPAMFNVDEVIAKIGDNPKCYLTGLEIEIDKPRTYHFDHIIPTAKGGDNSLDNLGICTRNANVSKADMCLDEYLNLCKLVLMNFGYDVTKRLADNTERSEPLYKG